jgi:hypothetical protein
MFFTTSNARDVPDLGSNLLLSDVQVQPDFTMYFSGQRENAIYIGLPRSMGTSEYITGPRIPEKAVSKSFIDTMHMLAWISDERDIYEAPYTVALYHYLEYFGICNPHVYANMGVHRFLTIHYSNYDRKPYIATIPELNITIVPFDAQMRTDVADKIYVGKVHDTGITFKSFSRGSVLPFRLDLVEPSTSQAIVSNPFLHVSMGTYTALYLVRFTPKRFQILNTELTNLKHDAKPRGDFNVPRFSNPKLRISIRYNSDETTMGCDWQLRSMPFYIGYRNAIKVPLSIDSNGDEWYSHTHPLVERQVQSFFDSCCTIPDSWQVSLWRCTNFFNW